MLFVHETHEVVGLKEDEFETLYRTGWMPMLAAGDDARSGTCTTPTAAVPRTTS